MTDLKTKTLICYDNGLFMDFCLKLADYFKEVYYYVPWKDAFPAMTRMVVGTEWKNGKRLDSFDGKPFISIDNFFDYLPKADAAFFPDVGDGDLQEFIKEYCKIPVFGSGKGEELELERWDTKMYFKKIGMDVQPVTRIIGVEALREHLKKVKDKWIKISKFRHHFETFHHVDYQQSEPILQDIEHGMGPMAHIAEFIVEDHIDAIVEEGIDAYCIDGKFPNYAFAGVEIKETSFAGMFSKYGDLSEGLREVNKKMQPILANYNYRGFISSEVRTTKDNKHYAIDPCCRLASPPSEIYQELYTNLGQIIWEGANGNLIDPKPSGKCALEVMIHSDFFNEGNHQPIIFPKEFRNNIKLRNAIKIDDRYYILSVKHAFGLGAIVSIGNTFDECKKEMEKIAPEVKGYGVTVDVDKVDEAIEQFKKTNQK